MPEQYRSSPPPPAVGRWRRFTAALPMRTALTGVTAVWLLGCVWSFQEQTHFAAAKGFTVAWLLPLVIDGLAAAMAGVAYAAGLDARPAVPARVATALAVAASAGSNAAWAWERSGADRGTVALAIGIPVAANLAFEVLLSELRRQVQRRRGQAPPVAVPYPRVIRFVLAPISTFIVWRRLVLELTDPRGPRVSGPVELPPVPAGRQPEPEPASPAGPAETPPVPTTPVPAGTSMPAAAPVPAAPVMPAAATVALAVASTNGVRREPVQRRRVPEGQQDDRVRRIADLLARGEELTGESVGEILGCSARTGRRLLRQGSDLAERRSAGRAPEPMAAGG